MLKFLKQSCSHINNFLIKSESRKAEVVRFSITGFVAVLIQYCAYYILVTSCNLIPVLSTLISYVISFIINFYLSNFFTFHSSPTGKKLLSFALSHSINLILQMLLVEIFSNFMDQRIALIPALIICVPTNFIFVRFALKSKYFQS